MRLPRLDLTNGKVVITTNIGQHGGGENKISLTPILAFVMLAQPIDLCLPQIVPKQNPMLQNRDLSCACSG